MKIKIYLLSLIFSLFFLQNNKAQIVTCNADFAFTVNGQMVNFQPSFIGDSLSTSHMWNFGDGSSNTIPVPFHFYASSGNYAVKHIVTRYNPNGTLLCRDSITKTITINAPCNAMANFFYQRDTLIQRLYHFTNLSAVYNSNDTLVWNFGDGTPISNQVNPSHQFANVGSYTVCLTLKKYVNPGMPACVNTLCKVVTVADSIPCNLQANFTYVKDSINRKKVYFTNQTLNLLPTDSVKWNFGDGSAFNYTTNPTHTYTSNGTYNVCLKVKRNTPAGTTPCVSEICKIVVIDSIVPCNLQANFSFVKDSINRKKVYFTNQTINFLPTDSIRWNFGDGSAFNYTTNPTHTYTSNGTYNVCLRIKRSNAAGTTPCVSEICKIVVIDSIIPCNLQANFSFVKDSINRKKVYFTNQTVNLLPTDSVRWNFGDGSAFNYTTNPTHTYTSNGTYNVCLKVKRNTIAGTPPCISEICKIVVIDSIIPCNLQANFSFVKDSINRKKVYFTNQTLNLLPTDSVKWNFGDGSAFNYTTNPTHTYTSNGTYNVCLRIKRSNAAGTTCVSDICKIVVIDSIAPCNLQANFSFVKDSVNRKKVYFTNQTLNLLPTDSVRWNFGDGSAFNYTTNPTHTYTSNGTYNVCLKVKRNTPAGTTPCVSEICKIVVIDSINSTPLCNYLVDFSMQRDSLNLRKVHFTNLSSIAFGAIATWYFGDGTSATGWNVTHTYPTAGAYYPCLVVKYTATCSKVKCKVLQLPATTACNLSPYPNPASNVVNATVQLTQPLTIYTRVYNSSNIIVRQQQQNGFVGFNTVTVNVATLPFGVYRLVITYGNKECKGTFLKN